MQPSPSAVPGGSRGGHHGNVRGGPGGSARGGSKYRRRKRAPCVPGGAKAERPGTTYFTSDGTDELVAIPVNSASYKHLAGVVLRNKAEDFAKQDGQRAIRDFVNSCLVNMSGHNGMDASGVFNLLSSEAGCACLERILSRPMSVDAGNDGIQLSFQYVVLPLVGVLTRKSVCQSVMTFAINRLYSTVYNHRKAFLEDGVLRCMDQLIEKGSLQDGSLYGTRMAADKSLCQVPSFQHALLAISRLLYQLVKRFEFAKFDLENIIHRLSGQRDACIPASDVDYAENFLGSVLEKEIGRLVSIVSHAHTTVIEPEDDLHEYQPPGNGPNIPHLISVYDPPGDLSKYGQRHDNDNMEISSINILPTLEELKCIREPFLPSNCIPQAPHFLPHGWKRQMDIQFRLFREDLMNPLKNGLMSFLDALSKTSKGKEEELLRQKVFKGNNEGINANANVNVDVYGDVQFHKVECDIHGKDFATVTFAQPYQNRNSLLGRRRAFWEQSKGRLMQGGLVLMVRRSNNRDAESSSVPDIVLGVVAEREPRKLAMDEEHASILISLMDPKLYFAMIDATNPRENRQWFLVEPSGAFFESYRPVLEVLQTRLPSTMPFGKYMAPTNEEAEAMLPEVKIDPPMYARAPGFRFDLSVLMNGQELKLDVTNPESPAMVLDALQRCKTLDDTQARALVNTLCREVSLINGPPGTGKTRIGVELMRVLLHNMRSMNSGPILCICYTNHALDQFLEHLLDKKITNIVRVGSQSKSTRLEDYNLQAFVDGYKKPRRLKKAMTALNEQWRTLCKRIDELQEDLQRDDLSWKQVEEYLRINHPGLWEQFVEKPLFDLGATDGFTEVRRGRKKSLFHQWVEGDDINELKRWNQEVQEVMDTKWHAQSRNSFGFLDDKYAKPDEAYLKRIMYDIPNKNRPVEELLNSDIWTMSKPERKRLANSWRPGIREPLMNELTQALEAAKEAIAQKLTFSKEIRRDILSQTSVIGMTTSGAAGRHELISAIAPKIIICEEAGEVVESHLLATLSSSTQHLIMIGDHLQLRPQIQTHNLSSESRIGRHHNLNISLFERLAQEEMGLLQLPLSRLTVQRRMRPEISSLIRIPSLYPYLEDGDGDNVHYDNVSGMSENLYFMDHSNPVDSKDQFGPQSFSNTFEVRMVGALVEYLMNNGYNRPGDIAVLTPYLGQHKKLQSSLDHIRLVMDENEQDQLNNQGADKEPLDDRLTVRTIDNFQGEEAKVVIISLVRNAKKSDGSAAPSGTIGFLKSSNRTNVLLSRAKHGMFLIGNASLMEKEGNGIWPEVIDKLRQSNRVGDGYPVACMKHPEAANIVTTPEMLREVAPDGGCDRPCGYNLTCGHVCPRKCHPVDPEHKLFKCPQPCVRLRSDCDHICPKTCGEPCGDCMVVVDTIELGCGHVLEDPSCYQAKDPSSVHCRIELTMHQSSCEHEYVTECGNADNDVLCHKPCGSPLDCGHGCIRSCSECQKLTTESGFGLGNNRTTHGQCLTKCDLMQPCGHPCEFSCHVGTPCPPCKQRCLKQCAHGQCRKSCHGLCDDDICLQPCTWECPHYGRCEMPCGLPCNRPPCNKRCQKMLNCGHQCPSVCGEECPPQKFCIQCQDAETMNLNVLMYPEVKCLRDQNVDNDPVLVLTCGHAVAMSVLDRESMKANTQEGGLNVPQDQNASVRCPRCKKSTANLMRYGHRVKYLRLDVKIKGEQVVLSKEMREIRERIDKVQETMEKRKDRFLTWLSRTEAPRMGRPTIRRLGKPSRTSFPFPQSDVRFISKIYDIPTAHEKAWRALVDSLTWPIQEFTSVYRKVWGTSTIPGHSPPPLTTDPVEEAPEEEAPEGLAIEVLSMLATHDYPWNRLVGSVLIDSIQERIHVLFIILSLAFDALDEAGSVSGWYWFVEDLLNCTHGHVMMMRDIALQEDYKRRVIEARLMYIDLICKRTLWIGLGTLPIDDDEKEDERRKLKQLQEWEKTEQAAVKKSCLEMGLMQHYALAARLSVKMTRAIKVARDEIPAVPEDWENEDTSLLWPSRHGTCCGSKYRIQCVNGHSFIVDKVKEPLSEWRCNECHEGSYDSWLSDALGTSTL